jgi:CheY-like chemotaxis protein
VATASQLRVLVAEDETSVRNALERFLTLKGCRVTSVPDGAAALTALDAAEVDLVISDLVMPVVGGVDLWRKACEARPRLRERWIFLSAYPKPDLPDGSTARHLQKPVELSALWDAVRGVLREAGMTLPDA